MKLLQPALIAGAIAASLTGCTYSDHASEAEPTRKETSRPPSSASSSGPMTFEGQFQSQAAVTEGTATIHVTDTGAVLQLENFSTAPGEDLRLMLSPGTVSTNDKGELALTDLEFFELGPLNDTGMGIHMDTEKWSSISPIRSVVIYNYAERTAYGTANLTQQP